MSFSYCVWLSIQWNVYPNLNMHHNQTFWCHPIAWKLRPLWPDWATFWSTFSYGQNSLIIMLLNYIINQMFKKFRRKWQLFWKISTLLAARNLYSRHSLVNFEPQALQLGTSRVTIKCQKRPKEPVFSQNFELFGLIHFVLLSYFGGI